MNISKLEHWKTSIEIDYLALYIKTWFAFLESVKQMNPVCQSRAGDKPYIEKYIDNLTLPNNFDTDIKKYIKEAFVTGQSVIKKDLPSSFFKTFYSINDKYTFSLPHTNHIRFKILYRHKLDNKKKPHLLIDFKSIQKQFYTKYKTYYFSFNILIQDIIDKEIYTNQDLVVKYIIQELRIKAIDQILSRANLRKEDKTILIYLDLILAQINQLLRQNIMITNIFHPLPVLNFPEGYDEDSHKIVVLKWFVKFCYVLRNILFHHIIDPFDDKWLQLFKSTYFALTEIVNHNIRIIKEDPNLITTTQSSGNQPIEL